MGLVRAEFEKSEENDWVEAYGQCNKIVNGMENKEYSRMKDAKDTMKKCQDNHHDDCMNAITRDQFSKKEDAISWVEKEMEKVGSSLTKDDKEAIEGQFPKQVLNKGNGDNPSVPQKSNYSIEVWQNGSKINGTKITSSDPVTLKLKNKQTKNYESSVSWKNIVNDGYESQNASFTPSSSDKKYTITCVINELTIGPKNMTYEPSVPDFSHNR